MSQRTSDPYKLMKGLKDKGMQFTMEKTLFTMNIDCDYGKFQWISKESEIPQNELYFTSLVSNAVSKLPINMLPEVLPTEVKYFDTRNITGSFDNCYEVDITSAYWAFAKEFLPKDVYERGLKVSKKTRLAALGGLAKTTTTMIFDGKTFTDTHLYTKPTRNFFFHCAKKTGDVVGDVLSLCDNPLFYWVDAIFTSNEADLKYIYAVLRNSGLDYKQYFCEHVTANNEKIIVHSDEHYKKQYQKWLDSGMKGKPPKAFREFQKERLTTNHFIGKFKQYLYKDVITT